MYHVNYVRTTPGFAFFMTLLSIFLFLLICSASFAGEKSLENEPVMSNTLSSKKLTLRKTTLDQLTRSLDAFAKGKIEKLTLYVNFNFDKSKILDIYQKKLNKIGTYVSSFNKNEISFAMEGHTDAVGTNTYNIGLSMRRAHAVRQYFISHFKLKVPFHIQYWGESRPRQSNASSLGRLENRRVELILQRPSGLQVTERKVWPADSKKPVTFSPDGRYIVSVKNKGDGLKQWNLRYTCRQRTLNDLSASPYSIVYSPNGRLLLSAGADNKITIWDAETGLEMNKMTGHHGMITEIAISPNGRLLLSGSFDKMVKYWNLQSALPIHTFSGHKDKVLSVAISSDGNLGASGANDGEIIIWDMNLKKLLKKFNAHQGAVTSVKFSSISKQLFSASSDGIIKQWDIDSGSIVKTFTRGTEKIVSIDLDKQSRRILAATQQKGMILWDALSGSIIKTYSKNNVVLTAADLSPNSNLIAATDSNNSIHIWETDTGKEVNVLSENPAKGFQEGTDPGSLPSMLELTAGEQWIEPHTGMAFVWVPGGCYQMGCGYWTDSCSENEKPVHENCVDGFWMGQSEVTQGQWTKVMESNPSRFKKGVNDPVNQISWGQTQDFICRMNTITGMNFRLPSEAEWEYACRSGGKQVKYGQSHSTNDASDDDNTSGSSTAQNALGLYNMSGGVWEWNLDLYSDIGYTTHEQLNPVFKGDNAYHFSSEKFNRVERGGSWDIGTTPIRCAHRDYDEPGLRGFFLGARLLLMPY